MSNRGKRVPASVAECLESRARGAKGRYELRLTCPGEQPSSADFSDVTEMVHFTSVFLQALDEGEGEVCVDCAWKTALEHVSPATHAD